jgi:hypothetical protein
MVQLGIRISGVLRARVVREVHAVPRGDEVDDADPPPPGGRRRGAARARSPPGRCDRINGKCLCPLGETAAIAVASYVDKFRSEFQAHIDEAGCPFGDASPLHDVLAPVAMHTHSPTAVVPA